MHAYAFAAAQAAAQSARQYVESTIEILEHERDQLIPLVIEGPPHLRPLRLRQLKSIEHQLAAQQAEKEKFRPELHP